jgi:hypothetical protein
MPGAVVSLGEVVRAGVNGAVDELHTAMPGKVTAYDPLTNTIVVQPGLQQGVIVGGKRQFFALPEIPFVPVIFPRAGGFVLRMPIEPGDWVWLMFSEGSLAEWKRNGDVVQPQDARRHSIGWPVAIPGCFPNSNPPSPIDAAAVALGQAIFGEDGGKQLRVGPTGIELAPAGVTPIMPIALAPPIVAFMSAVAAWIAAASPRIADIPTPLTAPEIAALSTAAGTVASTASTAATGTPSTLVRST